MRNIQVSNHNWMRLIEELKINCELVVWLRRGISFYLVLCKLLVLLENFLIGCLQRNFLSWEDHISFSRTSRTSVTLCWNIVLKHYPDIILLSKCMQVYSCSIIFSQIHVEFDFRFKSSANLTCHGCQKVCAWTWQSCKGNTQWQGGTKVFSIYKTNSCILSARNRLRSPDFQE